MRCMHGFYEFSNHLGVGLSAGSRLALVRIALAIHTLTSRDVGIASPRILLLILHGILTRCQDLFLSI
jgi:hypothetical protein